MDPVTLAAQAAAFYVAVASLPPIAPALPRVKLQDGLILAAGDGVRMVLWGKHTMPSSCFRADAVAWLHDLAMALYAIATSGTVEAGGAVAAFRDARTRSGELVASQAMRQLRVFLEHPEALPGVVLFVMCSLLGVRQLDGIAVPTVADWKLLIPVCDPAVDEVMASTSGAAGGAPARLAAFVRQAHAQLLFEVCEYMFESARRAVVQAPIFATFADALTAVAIEAAEGLAAKPPVNTMAMPWVRRSDAAQLLALVDEAAHGWATEDQRPVANTIVDALAWKWLPRIGASYSQTLLNALSVLLCTNSVWWRSDPPHSVWRGCPRALCTRSLHIRQYIPISAGASELLYKRSDVAGLLLDDDNDMACMGVGKDLLSWASRTDGTPTEQIVRRAMILHLCPQRRCRRADASIEAHGDGRLRVAVRQAVTTCVGGGGGGGGGAAGAGDGASKLKRQRVGSSTNDEHAAVQVLSFMAANPVLCVGEDGTHTELLENVLGCL